MYSLPASFYVYLSVIYLLPSLVAVVLLYRKKPKLKLVFGVRPNGGLSLGSGVVTAISKPINFRGRASRSEFWWFFLIWMTVLLPVGYLISLHIDISGRVFGAISTIPMLAVGTRRLHDIGRSGLWQILSLTIVGFVVLFVLWATPPLEDEMALDQVFE